MDSDPFAPHVESFNQLIDEGLNLAIRDVIPEEWQHPNGQIFSIAYIKAWLTNPTLGNPGSQCKSLFLYPVECRQRGISYCGKLNCTYAISVDGELAMEFDRVVADFPIMVQSKLCNLSVLDEYELGQKGEEMTEKGGFFIIKGNDKLLRLLIVMRQNVPLALIRMAWREKGFAYTEYGIMLRCVKGNHSSIMHSMHYLLNKRIMFNLTYMKSLFTIPTCFLVMALGGGEDGEDLKGALFRGREEDTDWIGWVQNIFTDLHQCHVNNQQEAFEYLGRLFRKSSGVSSWVDDEELGKRFIKQCLFIHLDSFRDKFDFFMFCIHKLRDLVLGKCKDESPDSPMFQEVALPAHTIMMLLKEKMKINLRKARFHFNEIFLKGGPGTMMTTDVVTEAFTRVGNKDITQVLEYFLATGNLGTNGEVVLPQANGFAIVAERINHFRYISHFRGIHRGAVFQDMRTTDVRKLKPEAWGFLCPVHTPDGAPCGLLNHLTASCVVSAERGPTRKIMKILNKAGFIPIELRDDFESGNMKEESDDIDEDEDVDEHDDTIICDDTEQVSKEFYFPVLMNGRLIGHLPEVGAYRCLKTIRKYKTKDTRKISPLTEVVLVPRMEFRNIYPTFYIFTNAGRMMRPVYNLEVKRNSETGKPAVEYIGTFEQIFLNIAVTPTEIEEGLSTHVEISPSAMFSYVASLIPFPDHNQSPRNVYQCQMSKQTMGSTFHSVQHRADNKLYRLVTPQTPLVKTDSYDILDIDRYPLGTNAIVAVIAYTGYDMEDGMVINKASYDRGFAAGIVYKCERVDLRAIRGSKPGQYVFRRDPDNESLVDWLDPEGLPYLNRKYETGDPLCCYLDVNQGTYKIKTYWSTETCLVDTIKICGAENGEEPLNHVLITLRMLRKPNIGDKFASRHGQKGICSFLWPVENMPFTESGMVPDIIFNPHGFPSRMTVGMMIESMAGKSATAHGMCHDASPFMFSDETPAIDFFGECLKKAGYSYYGNEPMYSGIDGREFEVQIFVGMVYYQRLRHMVADKFQVRASGPVDPLTKQPVKGRKKAGGVRFGEMERDGLIAHGAATLLHERLFVSSDRDTAHVCSRCGHHVSIVFQIPQASGRALRAAQSSKSDSSIDSGSEDNDHTDDESEMDDGPIKQESRMHYCRICKTSRFVKTVGLPHVFKYLMAELICAGVAVKFNLKKKGTRYE